MQPRRDLRTALRATDTLLKNIAQSLDNPRRCRHELNVWVGTDAPATLSSFRNVLHSLWVEPDHFPEDRQLHNPAERCPWLWESTSRSGPLRVSPLSSYGRRVLHELQLLLAGLRLLEQWCENPGETGPENAFATLLTPDERQVAQLTALPPPDPTSHLRQHLFAAASEGIGVNDRDPGTDADRIPELPVHHPPTALPPEFDAFLDGSRWDVLIRCSDKVRGLRRALDWWVELPLPPTARRTRCLPCARIGRWNIDLRSILYRGQRQDTPVRAPTGVARDLPLPQNEGGEGLQVGHPSTPEEVFARDGPLPPLPAGADAASTAGEESDDDEQLDQGEGGGGAGGGEASGGPWSELRGLWKLWMMRHDPAGIGGLSFHRREMRILRGGVEIPVPRADGGWVDAIFLPADPEVAGPDLAAIATHRASPNAFARGLVPEDRIAAHTAAVGSRQASATSQPAAVAAPEETGVGGGGGGGSQGLLHSARQLLELCRSRPTVVLCSPNGGMYEMYHRNHDLLDIYKRRGCNMVVWNYRSYGRSSGSPSPGSCQADAEAVVEHLRTHLGLRYFIAHGESIGGVAATHLAAAGKAQLLVGDRNFSTLTATAKYLVAPWTAPAIRLISRWETSNVDRVLQAGCPKVLLCDPVRDHMIHWEASLVAGLAWERLRGLASGRVGGPHADPWHVVVANHFRMGWEFVSAGAVRLLRRAHPLVTRRAERRARRGSEEQLLARETGLEEEDDEGGGGGGGGEGGALSDGGLGSGAASPVEAAGPAPLDLRALTRRRLLAWGQRLAVRLNRFVLRLAHRFVVEAALHDTPVARDVRLPGMVLFWRNDQAFPARATATRSLAASRGGARTSERTLTHRAPGVVAEDNDEEVGSTLREAFVDELVLVPVGPDRVDSGDEQHTPEADDRGGPRPLYISRHVPDSYVDMNLLQQTVNRTRTWWRASVNHSEEAAGASDEVRLSRLEAFLLNFCVQDPLAAALVAVLQASNGCGMSLGDALVGGADGIASWLAAGMVFGWPWEKPFVLNEDDDGIGVDEEELGEGGRRVLVAGAAPPGPAPAESVPERVEEVPESLRRTERVLQSLRRRASLVGLRAEASAIDRLTAEVREIECNALVLARAKMPSRFWALQASEARPAWLDTHRSLLPEGVMLPLRGGHTGPWDQPAVDRFEHVLRDLGWVATAETMSDEESEG